MNRFIFDHYVFDRDTRVASFYYAFEDGVEFTETITFDKAADNYREDVLDRAMFLSFLLVGTSYYKLSPSKEVVMKVGGMDDWQVAFANTVYQEGMGQFVFENALRRNDLVTFKPFGGSANSLPYLGEGMLALQSGGKDSLLTAVCLSAKNMQYSSCYMGSTDSLPYVIREVGSNLLTARRGLDVNRLRQALDRGVPAGYVSGHVPVTYIVASYALIHAVLNNANTVLLSIGHEGEEAHEQVGDLLINHQWAKTWEAEKLLAEYVSRYISPDIRIGSPLRAYSELRIAELFVEKAWEEYGHSFSSCNLANYKQGHDNNKLTWCGECPKCANSFLLFAPFLPVGELESLFDGKNLFQSQILVDTFKGLLGVDGVMKPFECVGQVDELQKAYHMAMKCGDYKPLPFDVPESDFDYMHEYPAQDWAMELVG